MHAAEQETIRRDGSYSAGSDVRWSRAAMQGSDTEKGLIWPTAKLTGINYHSAECQRFVPNICCRELGVYICWKGLKAQTFPNVTYYCCGCNFGPSKRRELLQPRTT